MLVSAASRVTLMKEDEHIVAFKLQHRMYRMIMQGHITRNNVQLVIIVRVQLSSVASVFW